MRPKRELKAFAEELRRELGQGLSDPFDARGLALLYGVPVVALSQTECSPQALAHFTETAIGQLSGALVPMGHGALILENDSHSPERRLSTMAHELAHLTLEHEFSNTVLADRRSCSAFERDQEAEAAELGGELLIPSESAYALARMGVPDTSVSEQFEVSLEMARWRMNATGARKVAAARRKAYRRAVEGA